MKYFTEDELVCTHCGKSGMDETFMNRVDTLRDQLGFPFPVNSAYRCPEHPIEARKSHAGVHSIGHAIDIGVRGEQAHMLLYAALEAGFTGIGINQKGNSRFIHLDDIENSPKYPRPTVWSY
mgnify:CR=1 FL=1